MGDNDGKNVVGLDYQQPDGENREATPVTGDRRKRANLLEELEFLRVMSGLHKLEKNEVELNGLKNEDLYLLILGIWESVASGPHLELSGKVRGGTPGWGTSFLSEMAGRDSEGDKYLSENGRRCGVGGC
jgi:hypothetical protein